MDMPQSEIAAALALHLDVTDAEAVAELSRFAEGEERDAHALRALKIGLLALRQAAGAIDADAVRREGEQILNKLKVQLQGHQAAVHDRVEDVLRNYFDPESGRFEQRIERLIKKDGDLERVLREQVGADDSTLRRTLTAEFGPGSPLMKILSPSESEGLLKSLENSVAQALRTQSAGILAQFSLNVETSALSRLVKELSDKNEDITEKLKTSVSEVVAEFSLDKDDSALSKLVHRVDEAQRKISSEFSLDHETSALARMKSEMLGVLEKHAKNDQSFRETVIAGLAHIRGVREERSKGTRHGDDFEADLFREVERRAVGSADVATRTANTTGAIPNSKVGDIVLELGPDHVAAGARIVIEAKEDRSYTLARASAEINVARRNRKARVGLFAFSRSTAPEGLPRFHRLGMDLFLIWDASDPQTDVWLEAGLEVAKALCTRAVRERDTRAAEFEELDRAINAVMQQANLLDEIALASNSIDTANEKIRERVRIAQKKIRSQITRMTDLVTDLRTAAE